ncbi:MAG: AtpZ/AtpI family protein [Planctomycetota bacterium]
MDEAPKDSRSTGINPWRLTGMGTELAGSIIGPGLIGWLIDRWAGTTPTWTLILAAIGIIGGGYNFFRQAMALNRQAAAAYQGSRRPRATPTARPPASSMFASEDLTDMPDDVAFPEDEDDTMLRGDA